MRALCLVAHPDDCVIFGLSYIYHHPEHDWTVAYLTYTPESERGAEMAKFWQRRNIPTVFLGFEDHWHDNEQKKYTRWKQKHAEHACRNLARKFDLVLTHDELGDYGHIHHQLVHQAVCWHWRLVTFAPVNNGTVTLTVPPDAYTLQELPLHGEIIAGFHSNGHSNSYKEPKCI